MPDNSSAELSSTLPRPNFHRTVRPAPPSSSEKGLAPASVVFDNVTKVYRSSSGSICALQDVDLSIPKGSIFGIIGRSGAGKSSLLRTINRLETLSNGRVLVDGRDVAELDEAGLIALRRRSGMIFQHFNLLSAKTVWANIALPLVVSGATKAQTW